MSHRVHGVMTVIRGIATIITVDIVGTMMPAERAVGLLAGIEDVEGWVNGKRFELTAAEEAAAGDMLLESVAEDWEET